MSKASDDLPDPETPVITVSFSWGIESEMFFRLWTRAPRILIVLFHWNLYYTIPRPLPCLRETPD